MLAALVLTACLVAAPDTCTRFAPLYEPMETSFCIKYGQQGMKEWADEHPASKWKITGYGCQTGKRVDRLPSDPDQVRNSDI